MIYLSILFMLLLLYRSNQRFLVTRLYHSCFSLYFLTIIFDLFRIKSDSTRFCRVGYLHVGIDSLAVSSATWPLRILCCLFVGPFISVGHLLELSYEPTKGHERRSEGNPTSVFATNGRLQSLSSDRLRGVRSSTDLAEKCSREVS